MDPLRVLRVSPEGAGVKHHVLGVLQQALDIQPLEFSIMPLHLDEGEIGVEFVDLRLVGRLVDRSALHERLQ